MIKGIIALLQILTVCHVSYAENYTISERPDIQEFIKKASKETGYTQGELNEIFKNVKKNDRVLAKIKKPYEDLSWARYQTFFVKPKMISAGSQFKNKYEKELTFQEASSGIPKNIIVSIIGVETFFGKYSFEFNALESLATLSFDYPPRAKFFSSELIALLKLSKKSEQPAESFKSSYAGAIGIPQFMPSSYLQYAKSENKKHADIITSYEDSISSVANYLVKRGKWEKGGKFTTYIDRSTVGIKSEKPEYFTKFKSDAEKKYYTKLTGSKAYGLWCADNKSCWVLHNNFMSILSYNKSPKYAMAVIKLSEKIT